MHRLAPNTPVLRRRGRGPQLSSSSFAPTHRCPSCLKSPSCEWRTSGHRVASPPGPVNLGWCLRSGDEDLPLGRGGDPRHPSVFIATIGPEWSVRSPPFFRPLCFPLLELGPFGTMPVLALPTWVRNYRTRGGYPTGRLDRIATRMTDLGATRSERREVYSDLPILGPSAWVELGSPVTRVREEVLAARGSEPLLQNGAPILAMMDGRIDFDTDRLGAASLGSISQMGPTSITRISPAGTATGYRMATR